MILLTLALLRAAYDIILFDCIRDRMFTRPDLQRRVPPAEVGGDVAFPPWLRTMALVAPLVGVVTFIVNACHVCTFVQRQKNETLEEIRQKEGGDFPLELGLQVVSPDQDVGIVVMINSDIDDACPVKVVFDGGKSDWFRRDQVRVHVEESNPWRLNRSEELTLLVIMMPAVFVVMAVRAEIRVLQIFLGTSFEQGGDWKAYSLWRRGTYAMDLECAAAFQYLTVAAFAFLCTKFFSIRDLSREVELREKHLILQSNQLRRRLQLPGEPIESALGSDLETANRVHHDSLTWAGLQGLWAYVIVGFLRCMFNIVTAGLLELNWLQDLHTLMDALQKFEPVFVFSAMLCVYNWTIIQRLPDIKRPEALGSQATLKFIAVRGLLLVGDGQKAALHGMVGKLWLHLSPSQADLLHAILLLIECLFVVTWNWFMWRDRRIRGSDELRRGARPLDAALLNQGS